MYLMNRYKKFIKYTLVGGLGAIIDIAVLAFLVEIFHIPIIIANTISFLVAVINNYIFNKIWTFRCGSKKYLKQFTKFLIVAIVGLGLNTILMGIAIHFDFFYIYAKIIIIFIVGIWNFLVNKYWTFNK